MVRFCQQRGELQIAHRWYAYKALEDLLAVPASLFAEDQLHGERSGEPAQRALGGAAMRPLLRRWNR